MPPSKPAAITLKQAKASMSHPRSSRSFHVMSKPTGAACNLNCAYCFYLEKSALYPRGSKGTMSDEVLEAHIRQCFECQSGPLVTLAWQGGEPTLMGLDFFRRAVAIEKRFAPPGVQVERTLQTNGVLLDDEWCRFLKDNGFLVGLSLDGPRKMHDTWRLDHKGGGTFDKVLNAARLLQQYQVDFNILATVNSANGDHPLEVYRFFRDEVKASYLQFIPIVVRDPNSTTGVTESSVGALQYGKFLSAIFDEWVSRDVGKIFVLNFDFSLANWLGAPSNCLFSPECGDMVALERNGDLYSCDHFVSPENLLGNIMTTPMSVLVDSDKQRQFGRDKRAKLPKYCLECPVLFACFGECPKNRFVKTPHGDEGLNYLCAGYRHYFMHVAPKMKAMANLLRAGHFADEIMDSAHA